MAEIIAIDDPKPKRTRKKADAPAAKKVATKKEPKTGVTKRKSKIVQKVEEIMTSLSAPKPGIARKITSVRELNIAMNQIISPDLTLSDVVFICIGTDRSTGDALGPLTGSALIAQGYKNVYGTIDDPVHAMNLEETKQRIAREHKGKKVIAIDACLGQVDSVDTITVKEGPMYPGAGVNKDLGPVGDYAISAIVNVGGFMEYFVLQNTRLSLVMRNSAIISYGLMARFPLPEAVLV